MLRLSIIFTLSFVITACSTSLSLLSAQPTVTPTDLIPQPTTMPTETAPPPLISPTVNIPTPVVSPTVAIPTPTPYSNAQSKTSLSITAPPTIKVGDLITITGRLSGMGIPQYTLLINETATVVVRYDGEVTPQNLDDVGLEFISASGSMATVGFILRATHPGSMEARISASGEIGIDQGNGQMAWSWGGATSKVLTLTITEE